MALNLLSLSTISMRMTRIKLCRFASGMLQTQLSKRASIDCMRLAAIESGAIEPRLDELDRIAAALGVSPDRLTGPESVPERRSPTPLV